MSCISCGRPAPGPLPPDSIAHIARPKPRATLGGAREVLCLVCQWWAAEAGGVIAC
jgi:hypothetical protein